VAGKVERHTVASLYGVLVDGIDQTFMTCSSYVVAKSCRRRFPVFSDILHLVSSHGNPLAAPIAISLTATAARVITLLVWFRTPVT
jgi:hypothetical protein